MIDIKPLDHELKKVEILNGKINFVCLRDQCPHSCCGPFGGVQHGISSIDGRDFSQILLVNDDATHLLESGYSHLLTHDSNGAYRMALLKDGTCTAFSQGKCLVHRVKPSVCRAFPFYVDMFVGLCGVTVCPGFGAGWTKVAELREEVTAAKRVYTYWIEEIEKKGGFVTEKNHPLHD